MVERPDEVARVRPGRLGADALREAGDVVLVERKGQAAPEVRVLREEGSEMTTRVLGIDPGARSFGWATIDGGRLIRCGLERADDREALARLVSRFALPGPKDGAVAVVELPRVYPQKQWKGDPADLIQVAVTAGQLVQVLAPWCDVQLVEPHAWKGSVPKDVMTRRIRALLDDDERAIVERCGAPSSLRHNVLDAAGIALWKAGRRTNAKAA